MNLEEDCKNLNIGYFYFLENKSSDEKEIEKENEYSPQSYVHDATTYFGSEWAGVESRIVKGTEGEWSRNGHYSLYYDYLQTKDENERLIQCQTFIDVYNKYSPQKPFPYSAAYIFKKYKEKKPVTFDFQPFIAGIGKHWAAKEWDYYFFGTNFKGTYVHTCFFILLAIFIFLKIGFKSLFSSIIVILGGVPILALVAKIGHELWKGKEIHYIIIALFCVCILSLVMGYISIKRNYFIHIQQIALIIFVLIVPFMPFFLYLCEYDSAYYIYAAWENQSIPYFSPASAMLVSFFVWNIFIYRRLSYLQTKPIAHN